MRAIKSIASILIVLTVSVCSQGNYKQLNESRNATKMLANNLQQKLKTALQTGGPIEALKVCNIEAQNITSTVSNEIEVQVGRTSLKTRNPLNIPDAWEEEVLLYFEKQKQSNIEIKDLELFEVIKGMDGKWFRYMKAIPTSEVCLLCHGEIIASGIQEKLQTLYPNDKATGYTAGDIRGAFTVKIKL